MRFIAVIIGLIVTLGSIMIGGSMIKHIPIVGWIFGIIIGIGGIIIGIVIILSGLSPDRPKR